MIKKLRIRFIISALLSIFFVLSVTMAAINIVNYVKVENESRKSLDMIVENEHRDMQQSMGINPNDGKEPKEPGGGGSGNPAMGGGGFTWTSKPREGDKRTQERYFTVVFSTSGEIRFSDYSHIFTITDEEAEKLAQDVFNSQKTTGKVGNLRYLKETTTDETMYMNMETMTMEKRPFDSVFVSFVDVSERLKSWSDFLVSSIVVALISYAVIAALIVFSSHFIFKTSEESYRKQKAFITNASHELKTPLTIINTDVEILKMDHGENEWTSSICDQVKRLTAMTNQLVTLSRLDEDNLSNYPFTSFSLSKLAKESADAFTIVYKQNKLHFTSEIEDGIEVKANQYLINELFYIFMDNALKYTKEKGSIALCVKKNKNKVEISFINDIEDQEIDLDQLFERFYRSPSSSSKEGSGIGLSIAKEIIDLHKGKINTSIKEDKIYFVITF